MNQDIKKTSRDLRLTVLAAALAAALLPQGAAAQAVQAAPQGKPEAGAGAEAAAAASSTPAEGSASTAVSTLDTVIVTVRKRAEAVQSVPVAVSAFNGENIERQKLTATQDLQFSIPNAMLTGGSTFTIRGIGNNATGGQNGVGLAVNGAGIEFFSNDELYDIERIEVLRGPQGTLFGRNTTGGAVATFTKRPTSQFGGNLSFELGNFNARRVGGVLNIPISENLQQRFAGYMLKRDGFTTNEFTGNDIDGRDQYGIRSSTRLFVGENTEINLMLGRFSEDSTRTREPKRLCKADPVLGCSPLTLGFDSPDAGAVILQQLAQIATPFPPGGNIYAGAFNPTDLRRVSVDFEPTSRLTQNHATLDISHDFEPVTLTYVGGYADGRIEQKQDWDNAALPFRFLIPITYNLMRDTPVTTDQLQTTSRDYFNDKYQSHEVRIASRGQGPLSYTTGLFYLEQKGSSGFNAFHPAVEAIQRAQGRPPETWFISDETKQYKLVSKAWFGEGQWRFSDALRATLGARWTTEKRDTLRRNIVLTDVVPFSQRPTIKEDAWTGRAAVDYVPAKDMLLYGSIASGYKGGGFNISGTNAESFQPEKVTAYEVGFKSEGLDGRLRANFSVFYNDYTNQQLSQRVSAGAITANVDSETYGVEAELQFAPTRAWLLDANISFLNTKFGDFLTIDPSNPAQSTSATSPAVPVNIAGNKLPYAPEKKFKIGAQYTMPLFNTGWSATARVDYVWQDEYFVREFNTGNDRIDAWSIGNLQLRFSSPKGDVQVKAFVKNVGDNNNITGAYVEDALLGSYRNVRLLDPRTYGVQVEYKF